MKEIEVTFYRTITSTRTVKMEVEDDMDGEEILDQAETFGYELAAYDRGWSEGNVEVEVEIL